MNIPSDIYEPALCLIYFALCVATAILAHRKGNNASFAFILALLLTPLVGLIVAACMADNRENPLQSGIIRKL